MSDKPIYQKLEDTRNLLEKLFKEVKVEESTLSGGTKLGIGGQAIQSLLETKISFGNPRDNLIRLTEELFKDIGIELNSIRRQQMKDSHDFYYMTLPVSMKPSPGVCFSRIECSLDFTPKGHHEPIVQTIFPKSEWKDLLNFGVDISLGLNGNLEWTAGIPENTNLPPNIKANAQGTNKLKAFIAIPEYRYALGKSEIVAVGEGKSDCFWRIDKPDLQKTQTVQFGIVFKVPKQAACVELSGLALAEADFQWLTSNLTDVFKYLTQGIKQQFNGMKELPIGDGEKWTLTLPK